MTPEAQTGALELRSPQTEEVQRAVSVIRPESPPTSSQVQTLSFEELRGNAIDSIATMSRCQEDIPAGVHANILSCLQSSDEPTPHVTDEARTGTIWTVARPTVWSATMFLDIFEVGEAHSQKSRILNMIGYMGAAKWYDEQVASAKPTLTKRGKPWKRNATLFLDSLMKERKSQHDERKRRRITNSVSKGRKFHTMINKAGLGILLLTDIW